MKIYNAKNIKPSLIELYKNFTVFMEIDAAKITAYYNKQETEYPQTAFNNLTKLQLVTENILVYFSKNKELFVDFLWFEYVEQIEEINNYLSMLKNSPKWLRLTKSQNGYRSELTKNNLLDTNRTIEQHQKTNNYYKNIDSDASRIEYDNKITELDYNTEDGINFKSTVLSNFSLFQNDSVIDVMDDDTIYGKDIDRNFYFSEEDIAHLDTKDTLSQSADILLNLTKGDNPEYSDDGVQKNLLIGTSKGLITLPLLIRQWQESFAQDSTFKNISVKSMDTIQDILTVIFEIEPIVGDSFTKTTTL